MNRVLTGLREWGCDIDGALERVLGDEEFFVSLLPMIAEDPAFLKLGAAIQSDDIKLAFDCAHDLKGSLANMGIDPLYKTVSDMVETLRVGSFYEIPEKYELLNVQLDVFKEIIK